MRWLGKFVFAISLCSSVIDLGQSTSQVPYFKRAQALSTRMLLTDSSCNFWTAVFKLVRGKSKSGSCLDELSKKAFQIDEDLIVGIAWVIKNAASLHDRLASDLLASLTSLPFWLNQGGNFQVPFTDRYINHWDESNQIAWLSSGYLIGRAFQEDKNKSDILFEGVDHTGHILTLQCKQRLWKWLDQRQRFGFSQINTKSITALATLATLGHDFEIQELAKMTLFLQLFEIEATMWQGHLLSSKIPKTDHDDLKALLWLLTGIGESRNVISPSSMVMIMCQNMGLEIPPFFYDPEFALLKAKSYFASSWGSSKHTSGVMTTANADDCLFWMSQDDIFGSAKCFWIVGNEFDLWHRHPAWRDKAKVMLPWPLLKDQDIRRLEALNDPLGAESGVIIQTGYVTQRFALAVVSSQYKGQTMKAKISPPITFMTDGGQVAEIWHPLWDKNHSNVPGVVPKLAQHKNTVFIINNPLMSVAMVFPTGTTKCGMTMNFTRVYKSDRHWFISQINSTLLAIYSYKSVKWSDLQRVSNLPQVFDAIGSHNVWILHAEEVPPFTEAETSFNEFVRRVANSQLTVHESFEDPFHECLNKHHCLSHGPMKFLACLRNHCYMENHVNTSSLARCLTDNTQKNHVSDATKRQEIAACLSKPLLDLQLQWQLDEMTFQFGWSRPLRVWKSNEELPVDDRRYRFYNRNIRSRPRDTNMTIKSYNGDKLSLNFEKITYTFDSGDF